MRWGLRMIRLRLEGMRCVIEPLDSPASQWLDRYAEDHWLWYRGGTRYEIDPRFLNSFLAAVESAAIRVERRHA